MSCGQNKEFTVEDLSPIAMLFAFVFGIKPDVPKSPRKAMFRRG